jgi:hypothetical protein
VQRSFVDKSYNARDGPHGTEIFRPWREITLPSSMEQGQYEHACTCILKTLNEIADHWLPQVRKNKSATQQCQHGPLRSDKARQSYTWLSFIFLVSRPILTSWDRTCQRIPGRDLRALHPNQGSLGDAHLIDGNDVSTRHSHYCGIFSSSPLF